MTGEGGAVCPRASPLGATEQCYHEPRHLSSGSKNTCRQAVTTLRSQPGVLCGGMRCSASNTPTIGLRMTGTRCLCILIRTLDPPLLTAHMQGEH